MENEGRLMYCKSEFCVWIKVVHLPSNKSAVQFGRGSTPRYFPNPKPVQACDPCSMHYARVVVHLQHVEEATTVYVANSMVVIPLALPCPPTQGWVLLSFQILS